MVYPGAEMRELKQFYAVLAYLSAASPSRSCTQASNLSPATHTSADMVSDQTKRYLLF